MISEIDEFWSLISSDNEEIQEEGFQKWAVFKQKNPNYMDNIKSKFSKHFYSVYQKYNFHDFRVLDIVCSYKLGKKSEIALTLYDYHKDYGKDLYFSITYRDIYEHTINANNTTYGLIWNIAIFEVLEENKLKHRILCCDGANIDITFKTVSIKKLKSASFSEK